MAFVSSAVTSFRPATLASASKCAISGTRVAVTPRRDAVVVSPSSLSTPRMAQDYPDSKVLGVGAQIPSSLFLIASALALPLGGFCVYQSNIFNHLSATTVNPQFVIGSLLVPISWGLHVAGFIQMKNDK